MTLKGNREAIKMKRKIRRVSCHRNKREKTEWLRIEWPRALDVAERKGKVRIKKYLLD